MLGTEEVKPKAKRGHPDRTNRTEESYEHEDVISSKIVVRIHNLSVYLFNLFQEALSGASARTSLKPDTFRTESGLPGSSSGFVSNLKTKTKYGNDVTSVSDFGSVERAYGFYFIQPRALNDHFKDEIKMA